ncbi:hypothetical protein [Pectinatus frisingensis]|nr:hypothetical protein [Pectinatus frisingensis]
MEMNYLSMRDRRRRKNKYAPVIQGLPLGFSRNYWQTRKKKQ